MHVKQGVGLSVQFVVSWEVAFIQDFLNKNREALI